MEKQKLKCPCGSDSLRVRIEQSVDANIYDDGEIDTGYDFSDPEVNKKSIWCEDCGEDLSRIWADPNYHLVKS